MSIDLPLAPPRVPSRRRSLLSHAHRIPDLDQVSGSYRLRFARTEEDLDGVRRLRFEVFNLELGEGLPDSYLSGRDEDEYDLQCQHLLVEHLPTGAVVGTYRMQILEAAVAGCGWYAASEFNLSSIPRERQRDLVELGRACVEREHRDRRVLFLLWQGIMAYARHNRRTALFGCSSLNGRDPATALRFAAQLEAQGRMDPELCVVPLPEYECRATAAEVEAVPPLPTPRLFASYLRYGATILGPPALDRVFGTLDFLTLVRIGPLHLQRFGIPLAQS
ncbi:MAG: GNAT family N-acetyltransferase [Planctomycetes bacterium]|nr:GNAT family N-acetyltransferase [Planctomycetota bacterium]MDA0948826.1 GNAT family N-acetyltransferase [Planctomycetota bacterium]